MKCWLHIYRSMSANWRWLRRIPLLVRRNKVAKALEWLKLNHRDYADLEISHKNLESYPEDSSPVVINYRYSATNKIPEAPVSMTWSLNMALKKACVLSQYIHSQVKNMTLPVQKHWKPCSKTSWWWWKGSCNWTFKRSTIYLEKSTTVPSNVSMALSLWFGWYWSWRQRHKLSDAEHKRHLLLYHDKHFQKTILSSNSI